MALDLPSVSVTVEEDGLAIIATPPEDIHVVMGCCSKGTETSPFAFGTVTALVAARGCGPGVKGAAYPMAKTGTQVVYVRLPKTTVAATKSAVDITDITDPTLAPSLSGTPTDAYYVIVDFVLGGTTGTGPITYRYSLDGGVTYSANVSLGTGLTIVPTGTGVTITLVTGKVITTGDSLSFSTTPAFPAVLPVTSTVDGATTSAFTISGTPEDAYEGRVEIMTGGTRGTAGITYRYSLDGGRSFTRELNLGTATSFQINDGAEDSGLDANFAAGDVTAGDVFTFRTTAPQPQDSDVTAALTALRTSNLQWSFIHVVRSSNATNAGNVGSSLATYATGAKYTWAANEARPRWPNEPEETWRQELIDDVANLDDGRVAMSAGDARITCPITGRQNLRPTMWIAVARILGRPMEEDPGRKATGALSSDVRIHDDDGLLVEHDARFEPSLHAARYVTLRTYEDDAGIYITRGNLMDQALTRIALRRVLDLGSLIFRRAMERQLENGILVNPPGKPNAGFIREVDALKIEREIRTALEDELVTTGRASGVSVQLTRTDPVLTNGGKLTCKVRITPLGYIDQFEGTIGYENPALTTLQAA